MRCSNCGTENADNTQYCQSCGAPLNASQTSSADYGYAQNPSNGQPSIYGQPPIPEEYKPISMWGYFGYELLFSIPCVGFILLLVFSFGGTKNVNLKNFARSYFCFLIILAVIFAIMMLAGVGAGIGSSFSSGF